MELDIDRKLGTLVGSLEHLVENLLEIQMSVVPSTNFSDWANRLRFIEVPKIDVTKMEDFFSRTMTLNLTNKDDYPGEVNYLAVSYCWDSFEISDDTESRPSYNIQTSQGLRANRVPTSVLQRSISYAVAKGIRFVWIDQECIDQADIFDLKQGVQCMDQVYRSASNSIGLLNTKISSISTFRAFTRILFYTRDKATRRGQVSSLDATDPQCLLDINCLLAEISADRWFYRNWTYQEASCTHGQMELQIPHIFGNQAFSTGGCLNEISLRLSDLLDFVSMIRNMAHTLPQLSSGVDNTSTEAMSGLYVQAWEQNRRSTRPQSFEVANQMEHRDNSVVADRLAITANLCEYAKRIDPVALSLKQYSYSLCALALALTNGAITPSCRSNLYESTGNPIFRWQDENIYNFLASPRYLSTAFAHPDRIEPRFADVQIRSEGLETSGWLWIVDTKIELRQVKDKHHQLLMKLQGPRNLEGLSPLLNMLFVDLIDELRDLGLSRIASTVCECTRVGNLQDALSSSEQILDDSMTSNYYIGHWMFDFVQRLLEKGYVWCGRLEGEEDCSSIFYCESEATVFTSSEIAFSNIPRPWMSQNFISCGVVQKCWSSDGVMELIHAMEPVHGIWHGTEDSRKRVVFPWGKQ